MVNWFMFRMLEGKAVETLLRSPTFHRAVQKVHKQVHQLQHGKPPEYYGGTNLENQPEAKQGIGKFVEYFWEELKNGHKPEVPPPKTKK